MGARPPVVGLLPETHSPMNKTTQLLRALWLKALRDGYAEVTFESPAKAMRMRFALYECTKREAQGFGDENIVQARQQCILRARGQTLTLTREDNDSGLRALADALGVDLDGVEASAEMRPRQAREITMPSTAAPTEDEFIASMQRIAALGEKAAARPSPFVRMLEQENKPMSHEEPES